MTRSQRLDPLLRIRQRRQDEVARDVAERDRALGEQEQRLELLRRYADEYAAAPANSPMLNPALLANRLAFRAKLEDAVAQQSRIVDHTRQTMEVERMRLVLASRDTKVLEQLKASYQADESRKADARTQRELDDIGARRVRVAREGASE